MVGIRSRDQITQLLVVGGVTTALFVVAALVLLTRGGDDATAAGGTLDSDGLQAQEVVAGASFGAGDGGGDRSSGSAGLVPGSDSESTSPVAVAVPSSTTSTEVGSTTEAESSSTTAPTTVAITTATTEATSTTVATSTTATTVPPSTSTTKVELTTTTQPVITIMPPTSEPWQSITRKDLAKARERWRSTGYDSYQMVVRRGCFCPIEAIGPFLVTVRRGEVQSIEQIEQRRGDPEKWLDPNSVTVPGLFDLIENSFDAARLHVVFDKNTGVPLTIEIDSIQMAVDDELTVTVRDFRAMRG